MAEQIAGMEIEEKLNLVEVDDLPKVLKTALNAVLNGAYYRIK
jgi:hypothetical protein